MLAFISSRLPHEQNHDVDTSHQAISTIAFTGAAEDDGPALARAGPNIGHAVAARYLAPEVILARPDWFRQRPARRHFRWADEAE